ncbi:MAG TPA: Hpt domain-containing protein [Alphaproteobacteria bacterium]|jgi:HPt (histidine-containing phosphotransfer) domain-containing protein|nr:Hpt domain-containing protein [Alphaproteobacteria bacterium]MDP7429035.1 Hpt domain-containing protein [Alphaproteobacteria bacterium]HJM50154.1 Hpt domain-containing protein [Alphaproteobacteria bacterium]
MNETLEQAMARLRREFGAGAVERLAAIRQSLSQLDDAAAAADALETLEREAHKLHGGGATFGMPLVSRLGGSLEELAGLAPAELDRGRLARLVAALGTVIEAGEDFSPADEAVLVAELGDDLVAEEDY